MTTPSTNPAEYFGAFYRTQSADGTDVRSAGWDIGQPGSEARTPIPAWLFSARRQG
ncbi:hypothetical protein K7711_08510 [Nocardia sp. CA2R105]|uniref:hypothetical protein n=1 Tax=Nocardia coffeae TaxID=2873381 RepID=UPI001CA772E9|nr:hypothetical protein [Nocardia coffeae]MBY8856516.1 hypothetical protein [Nocardia coffeae]